MSHSKIAPDKAKSIAFCSPITALASGISSTNEIRHIIPAEKPMPVATARSFRCNHKAKTTPKMVVKHDNDERSRTAVYSVLVIIFQTRNPNQYHAPIAA